VPLTFPSFQDLFEHSRTYTVSVFNRAHGCKTFLSL